MRSVTSMLGIILTITAMFLGVCFVFCSLAGEGIGQEQPDVHFWEKAKHRR